MSAPALVVAGTGDLFIAEVSRVAGGVEILTLKGTGWRSAHKKLARENLGPGAFRIECLTWRKVYGARVVLTRWTA